MAWNLVDLLSIPGHRRAFYPPIASAPPSFGEVDSFDHSLFDIAETYTDLPAPDFRTADVALEIRVNPPAAGLPMRIICPIRPFASMPWIGGGSLFSPKMVQWRIA